MCRRGEAVTQEQYVEAVAQRVALGQRLRLFFDRYDLLRRRPCRSRQPTPTRAPTNCEPEQCVELGALFLLRST